MESHIAAVSMTGAPLKCSDPAQFRRREPIESILRRILPERGRVLEIGSGARGQAISNLRQPLRLDVRALPWDGVAPEDFDAVIATGPVPLESWECCQCVMAGAEAVLKRGGFLMLYGPCEPKGRRRKLGGHDVAAISAEAAANGLTEEERIPMTENNLALLFRKRG